MRIYLDNAATSWPKPPQVGEAMVRFLAEDAGNPGRSGHHMAVAAQRMIEQLRSRMAGLFGADDADRVVFTLNATDAINMAIKGVVQPGDHVITTVLEHNSVSRPLQAMADAGFITLTRLPLADGGFVDPDAVRAAVTPKTRLIACTQCSNVIGTIQPIGDIGWIARECGVLLLVDAAQSAGLVPISMREMQIDLLAVPGHKSLLGPTGTGALLVGQRAEVRPWREGGTGGDSSDAHQPREYPHRLEGGTPNTVGLAGLAAALDAPAVVDPLAHERALGRLLVEGLQEQRRFRVLGPEAWDCRTGLVSFTCEGMASQDLAAILDQSFGIAVRAGLHCAPGLHRALGTFPDGSVRVSPGVFNTSDEIARLIDALRQIAAS